MKVSSTKTTRFSDVVKACGHPVPVVLWVEPGKDPSFMKAVELNRVMTLKQASTGTRRDFGVVGFAPGPGSIYLVFPKALSAFTDNKVIGIKYELLKMAGPVGPVVEAELEPRARPSTVANSSRVTPRTPRRFRVTIRFTATQDITEALEAASMKDARAKAASAVIAPDLSKGKMRKKVVKVEPANA